MNFRVTIGTLLISSGLMLSCVVFGPGLISSIDNLDRQSRPIKATDQWRIKLSPSSLGQQFPSEKQPHPPTSISTESVARRDEAVTPSLAETKPIQIAQNADEKIPDLPELGPEHQASENSVEPTTPVSAAAISNMTVGSMDSNPDLGHSVLDLEPAFRSPLEHHFSTPQKRYVRNRFVKLDGSRHKRTSEVEQISQPQIRHPGRNLLSSQRSWNFDDANLQEPISVSPANFESRSDSVQNSVIESSATEVRSVYTPDQAIANPDASLVPRIQQPVLTGQISSADEEMANLVQQPALPRQRVSPQVEARAREHIEYGESLARRNSHLAAREEFTLALLQISRSQKLPSAPDVYAERLAQGLTALDEAADFVGKDDQQSQTSSLQNKVRSHKTHLISSYDVGRISNTKALDYYCGYAQSQIEQAIGYSAAGSAALHALGKIELRASINNRRDDWIGQARALVFFRAAMTCDPANAVCANDLGVLLHDMGRLKEAEHALKVSLGTTQTQKGWANLAAVHSQMALNARSVEDGNRQMHFAKLADFEARRFSAEKPNNGIAREQWATMNEFQNNAAFPDATTQSASEIPVQTADKAPASKAKRLLQKIQGWY